MLYPYEAGWGSTDLLGIEIEVVFCVDSTPRAENEVKVRTIELYDDRWVCAQILRDGF